MLQYRDVQFKKLMRFFLCSAAAVSLDLLIFCCLTGNGWEPFNANTLSALLAVSLVYLTSVRYVFTEHGYGWTNYLLFIFYYSCSILFFSYLIQVLQQEWIDVPILAKIVTLPISFLVNYHFSSKIV